tara:strand:- start:105 stop:308 length:204 start_codon:yes stop_codon:yes gene_type:complete
LDLESASGGKLMIKTTIVNSVVMATPWWFFPGIEVARECFSCYLIGQLFSAPVAMLVAIGLAKLMGD